MSVIVPKHFDPVRRCANPQCRRVLTDQERTFHCADCHRTDPELIAAALAYWARVAAREQPTTEDAA
jgi:hypothetical protein